MIEKTISTFFYDRSIVMFNL